MLGPVVNYNFWGVWGSDKFGDRGLVRLVAVNNLRESHGDACRRTVDFKIRVSQKVINWSVVEPTPLKNPIENALVIQCINFS